MVGETTSIERVGAEIINTYLFDHVWNEPVSEYRSNIRPAKFSKRTVVGTFATTEGNIVLPTEREAYIVWTVGSDELGFTLNLNRGEWVDTARCISDYRTKFDFYDIQGRMFHKSGVYIRYNSDRRVMFIAAKKELIYKCSSIETINRNEVFLTTSFDSSIANDITLLSFKVGSLDSNDTDYQLEVDKLLAKARPETIIIYKNGVEITQGGSPNLTHGDWFDFIVDENIVFAFDVDLVSTHESPAYLSETDEMWKQLIHIPKALNPDNCICTHDTCDFYIRRAEGTTPYGLYMHRVAEHSVTQVTHNDFSIPLIVIDAYRDYLKEQEIFVHVVVRRHDKDNYLIPDANYIFLLYSDTHDDQRIIDILCGLGPSNIPWWRATNLEYSIFVRMMFDTPNSLLIDKDLMNEYIDALGYFHVINLLCPRILDTTVVEPNHTFIINKPMIYQNYDTYPLLYLNGKHIPFSKIKYSNTPDNTIFLTLDENLVIKKNDIITTIFCLSSNNKCCAFELDTDNLVINLPYTDPVVYLKTDTANNETIVGVNGTYLKSFMEVNQGDNIYGYRDNHDGTCTLTFNNQYIGGYFVIQNRYATYRLSYDITELVTSGKTMAINLEQQDADTLEFAPILNIENTAVYYNNKYLVKGIDYNITTLKDKDGNICNIELIIQSMDHYTDDMNQLDILINQDAIYDNSFGFMIDDKLYDDTPVNLMYSDIATCHVAGTLERNITNKGNYTLLPNGKYETGSIWELQTAVPRMVIDFIAKYSDRTDSDRIAILNEYFKELPEKEPDVIVIDEKHRIYSSFLNELIRLTLEGSVTVTIDPDQDRLDSALMQFDTIKSNDVVFGNLDQRFVDYYPQYVNQEIPPEYKTTVDYLINTYLPKNKYPSLHSVAEECR